MAEQDFYFQMTAETMQQRLNQVPINTSAIEQEAANRQDADEELSTRIESKQDALTFDDAPVQNSQNPVKSGGIKTAIDQMGSTKQNVLTFDNAPALGSLNPVTSNGIKQAVDTEEARAREVESALNTAKQDKLTFDNAPTPNSTNPVTSDGISRAIADFITASVNNLVNYYAKSQTYTKAEVQALVDTVKQFTYEVVETLPQASALTMNKIYLVPSPTPLSQNTRDEFITIAREQSGSVVYQWEQIGSTSIDLSLYSTTEQMNAAIANALAAYSTTAQMNQAIATALASYYTKAEIDAALATKQPVLTFDTAPAAGSANPVTSSGIKGAIDQMGATKQDVLTFDTAPTAGSANPVTSGGIAQAIQNFITRAVDDLVNYYTKTDTYTKTEVQALIASVAQFQFEVVDVLPTASAETMGKIYLIPSAHAVTDNVKDEYITILREVEGSMTYKWEQIGTTAVDLSGYYTKTEINSILADYSTTTQMLAAISQALTSYYTKTEIDTLIASYYTKTEVNNLLLPKADKVANATNGNLAELDANGNLRDAGKKVGDFQLKILDLAPIGFGKGTCSTAGNVAAKVVTIPNFLLLKGGIVCVYFTNAFTATGATLNINNLGAKAIKLYDSNIPPHKVHNHAEVTMMYDGEVFDVISIENQGESGVLGAVDLSLPSGLLWADHNVGAATPDAVGLYFSWGNVTGHAEGSGYDFSDAVYAETAGAALTGDIAVGNTYDMARHNMGAPWRLPTMADFVELNANCDSEWTDENGMPGRRFTSLINGNSIFFPAAGYYNGTSLNNRGADGDYWSSTWYSETNARYLNFSSTGVGPQNYNSRRLGFAVRAVQ